MPNRCSWVNNKNPLYVKYHDEEWGEVVSDDNKLFEALSLEIFQTGLSWEIVLNKRVELRKAFDNFSPNIIALYDDDYIEFLLQNNLIIRHRLKIKSIIINANIFLNIQKEFISFQTYVYSFNDENKLLKDLKKRGMKFIGISTIRSFMESIGIINAHELECFKHNL